MSPEEVKRILKENRPFRPHKTSQRQLQCAIDEACRIIRNYEEILDYLCKKVNSSHK